MNELPIDQHLSDFMGRAFAAAFADAADAMKDICVGPATSPEFGDYQCNAAMGLAKVLKMKPRDIAEAAVAAAPEDDLVDKMEVAGPGFINIHLKTESLAAMVTELGSDDRLGVPVVGKGQTIVMDYGSPNMSKPLHIGHLRSPNIGSALDGVHRALGYKVISDNHLGDWGTQFGITIMGYRHFGDAAAMEHSPMEELERVYVESYERGKNDEDWKKQCREELVKLQSGDPENLADWKRFMKLSLSELDRIYGRLGVSFDLVRGESYYHDQLQGVVDLLEEKGLAVPSEGALIVDLEEDKLPIAMVRKSDGGFNYMTTDIATVLGRVAEFGPDKIVYVTDDRQQLHFKQLFTIAAKLGIDTELAHTGFGLMRLPEGAFSTREGNVIKLEALLDEAEERALAVVKEQSPDMEPERQKEVARAVGLGAVKYADLSQNPQSLVTFTWDKAMSMNGNSAPYLQYVYARISSVRDKYSERFPEGDPSSMPISLGTPEERALALHLARLPEAMLGVVNTSKPNVLADYLYGLAQLYSSYYQNVPFLKAEEGIRESRVHLCDIVAKVMKYGLSLLGIETPERI